VHPGTPRASSLEPLVYIAVHVEKPKGVWLERPHKRGLVIPLTAAASATRHILANVFAPGIRRRRTRPWRILQARQSQLVHLRASR